MSFNVPTATCKLKLLLICCVIVICLPGVFSKIKKSHLTPKLNECYRRYSNVTLDKVVGKFLAWHCESTLTVSRTRLRLTPSQRRFIYNLAEKVGKPHRGKRQARRCVRKEYRMLTTQERNDFHRAINGLKRNTMVQPNVYDALAMLHSEMQILKAHGGPCFLGWHRVYMLMFEMALNDEVPGVCLPYWDSSLDSELNDPTQSYLFSPELLGNVQGPLTTGPFAGWRRPRDPSNPTSLQTPVIRNVGADGQLYTRQSIEMIMSRNDHSEIIAPFSDPDYDIEVHHGGVHMFIGGDMESLVTSPNDPIFFLLHSFVDYLWELFRMKLRNQLNIDPQTNYPMNHNIQFHGRDERMDIANFSCGDGYMDYLMDTVEYEASPSCTRRRPTCDSPYLRCQIETGRCIPVTIQDFQNLGPRPNPLNPRPGPGPFNPQPGPVNPQPNPLFPEPPPLDQCAHIERERHNVKPCQNAFCINGVCDINQWVYVPVKVVTIRPPTFNKYQSYPVINGDLNMANDIYNPNAYVRTKRIIESRLGKTPKGYYHCSDDGIGQIFVQSQGLNYDGFYKESSLIDQRLATTMSIAYIAVKDPGPRGVSRVLFRASDSCGRVCHTSCRNPRTGMFEPCSGVIEIDSRPPMMYSRNYGDATLDVWDYGSGSTFGSECPNFNNDNFFLTFYCDYKDHLPWVEKMTAPTLFPMLRQRTPVFRQTQECRVSPTCVVDVPCYSAILQCRFFGETHQCRGSCGRYAVCNYGHYTERYCSNGMSFDEQLHRCSNMACRGQSVRTQATRWTAFGQTFGQSNTNYVQNLGNRMLNQRLSILGGK